MKRRITIITREFFERAAYTEVPETTARAWCVECGPEVEMISPELAARLHATTTRQIYRQAEDGAIHFAETPDGLLVVCSASLTGGLASTRRKEVAGEV